MTDKRSRGSFYLLAAALLLALAFSVWCIDLAVSVRNLRATAETDVRVMVAIEAVRSILSEHVHDAAVTWQEAAGRSAVPLEELGDRAAFTAIVREQLSAVESALAVAPTTPAEVTAAHRNANGILTGAVAAIRGETAAISASLGSKWASLNLLAFLSVVSVAVLAVLMHRAQADSARRRLAEARLRESESRFRSVLSAVPDIILVMSGDGVYRHIYTAKPSLLVQPADNLVGQSIHTRLPEGVRDEVQAVIDRTLETGEMQTVEYPLAIRGEDMWFTARVVPFGSPEDPCVLWVARDRTEEHRIEEQRLESEQRFRQVAENIDEVVSFAPRGGRGIEYISPAFESIWGRSCESLYENPRSWLDAVHEDDRERVEKAFLAGSHTGDYDEEFRIVRPDGTIRWVRDRSFAIRNDEGAVIRIAGLTHDITERRLAEDAIREREEQLRSIIDTASEAVIVADDRGLIRLWNKASEEIFGHTAEEAVGRPIGIIVPERFREAHAEGMRRVAGGATPTFDGDRKSELTGLRKDGSEFPVELSFTAWGSGDRRYVTGIARDVTERRKAENAVRASEQRFRSAFEDTLVGMVLATPDGRFTRANRAFCEMMDYSEQELLAMTFRDITHPDDLEESASHVRKLHVREETHFTVEKRYVRKDGAVVWAITSVAPVLDAEDRVDYLVAETQDITERKRAEEKLRDSEERFRSIFELAGAGMHTAAPDGRYLQVNRAFCRFLGYTPEELSELTVTDVTYADDLQMTLDQFAEVQAGKRNVCDMVKRYVRKDGAVVWGHVTAVWLPATEDRDAYGVAMVQDVDQQRRAGQALLEAKQDLERRVVERTADLVDTNDKLTAEIAERKMAESIQRSHTRVLEELASGRSLEEVLTVLVEGVEGVYPDMLCVVLLLDEDGRHLRPGAAPSIPEEHHGIFDALPVGSDAGCCGAAAADGKRIIVEDVLEFVDCRGCHDLAQAIGVRSCWSQPIFSSEDEVLGIFAIYYRETRTPDAPVLEFITSAANLAGIAIERRRAEARLAESQERLRVSDRLASLGTLVAGLGHDMNNVLFPLRCRLDAVDGGELPDNLREVIESSRDSVEYLQQLGSGLRLLAADPEDTGATLEVTAPAAWWPQVRPLISKMVPAEVSLTADIPEDLPLITVAPHQLTQAVMNLVVNAAEAMPSGGSVGIDVRNDDSRHEVAITVSDDGVGMPEEIRQRALDPFFTTKTRSLSTGLGLSLVLGVVRRAKGTLTIDSTPGEGTAVRMVFPAAKASGARRRRFNGGTDSAAVTLRDVRTAAWVTNVLESAGYTVSVAEDGDPRDSDIWVTEATRRNLETARRFLTGRQPGQIIVLGPADAEWTGLGAIVVEDASNLEAIKSAVCEVAPIPS